MMETCANYGRVLKEPFKQKRDFLEFLSEPIRLNREGKNFILKLIYDSKNDRVKTTLDEINSNNQKEKAQEYLWVGNTRDKANEYITTNNIDRYLIGKDSKGKTNNTIYRLIQSVEAKDLGDKLKNFYEKTYPKHLNNYLEIAKLEGFDQYIANTYSRICQFKSETNKKNKKEILNSVKKLIDFVKSKDIEVFINKIINKEDLLKEIIALAIPNYYSLFFKIVGILEQEIVLITLQIDDELVVDNKDYIEYLYDEKFGSPIETRNQTMCSVCGKKSVTSTYEYLKKSKIKFFNTDKKIFSAGLTGAFEKNFALCDSCFLDLTLGEYYIFHGFKKKWAGNSVLLIPEITPIDDLNHNSLSLIYEKSCEINDNLYRFSGGRKIEKSLEELMERVKFHSLVFHYVYYSTDQGGRPNKIVKMIKDVPPTRLKEIITVINDIVNQKCISPKKPIDLFQIYRVIPIKIDKKTRKAKGKNIILDIYDSIFLKTPIDRKIITHAFAQTIKYYFFETPGYNITDIDTTYKMPRLIQKILMMNTVLEFLEKIFSLKRIEIINNNEGNMTKNDKEAPNLWDAIQSYWKDKSAYNLNETKALFLLGIMVSDVGSAQFQKGLKTEPVLKKLNFDGMNRGRIMQLFNDVEGKLINYKKFPFDKNIDSKAKQFFDSTDSELWDLTPSENVFYIMSGYAFKKEFISKLYKKEEIIEEEESEDYETDSEE